MFWVWFDSFPKVNVNTLFPDTKNTGIHIALFVRDRFTAEFTCGLKDKQIFIELKYFQRNLRSSPKREKCYAERILAAQEWYQVAITCVPDRTMNELVLYINGVPEATVRPAAE